MSESNNPKKFLPKCEDASTVQRLNDLVCPQKNEEEHQQSDESSNQEKEGRLATAIVEAKLLLLMGRPDAGFDHVRKSMGLPSLQQQATMVGKYKEPTTSPSSSAPSQFRRTYARHENELSSIVIEFLCSPKNKKSSSTVANSDSSCRCCPLPEELLFQTLRWEGWHELKGLKCIFTAQTYLDKKKKQRKNSASVEHLAEKRFPVHEFLGLPIPKATATTTTPSPKQLNVHAAQLYNACVAHATVAMDSAASPSCVSEADRDCCVFVVLLSLLEVVMQWIMVEKNERCLFSWALLSTLFGHLATTCDAAAAAAAVSAGLLEMIHKITRYTREGISKCLELRDRPCEASRGNLKRYFRELPAYPFCDDGDDKAEEAQAQNHKKKGCDDEAAHDDDLDRNASLGSLPEDEDEKEGEGNTSQKRNRKLTVYEEVMKRFGLSPQQEQHVKQRTDDFALAILSLAKASSESNNSNNSPLFSEQTQVLFSRFVFHYFGRPAMLVFGGHCKLP